MTQLDVARIVYLSKEIETVTTSLMTFRTRISFTVLLGPFIVMGSVLFATRGAFVPPESFPEFIKAAYWAGSLFCLFGFWGGFYDNYMCHLCRKYRNEIKEEDPPEYVCWQLFLDLFAYVSGCVLVLVVLSATIICLSHVLPVREDSWKEISNTFEECKRLILDGGVVAGANGNAMASSDLLSWIAIGIAILALAGPVLWKSSKGKP